MCLSQRFGPVELPISRASGFRKRDRWRGRRWTPILSLFATWPIRSSGSSTETVNEPSEDPAVPVVGGAALKTTLVGVPGPITVAAIEVAVVIERLPSVALKV